MAIRAAAAERVGHPAVAVEVGAAGGEGEGRPAERHADGEPAAPVEAHAAAAHLADEL